MAEFHIKLPVWGQRWTNPRRALGPSEGYKHEFRLDGDTEGISVLTLNVPNEPSIKPNTEHDHSVFSSFPPSLLFTPRSRSRFGFTFGDSLHQDVLATADAFNYADHLVHTGRSQQQSSPLDTGAFSDRFDEEIPRVSNRSGFRFDHQDDHQITPNMFGASSAHDPSSAGVARHTLTFSSDSQFSARTRIALSCRVPTTIPEGESVQWSTSLPHENISRCPPTLHLQYDSPVVSSSFSGYTLPHPISGMNASWHDQENEATLGPALWGLPDLSTLSANGAPGWPAGYGPPQPPQPSAVSSQSSGSIIPDFDPLCLSPLEVGLYDFPTFGAE